MTLREFSSSMREFERDPAVRREDPLVVMMADDEEDHYFIVERAFKAAAARVELRWAPDGLEAMDYLLRRGRYAAPEFSPRPDLILLDLVMPIKDGLETLQEIKGNRGLRNIPLMLLTSPKIQEHEDSWLRFVADSSIIKPRSLDEMVAKISDLHEHYFGIVRLPDQEELKGFEIGKSKIYGRGCVRSRSIDGCRAGHFLL
ncbi:MAG: response regulator [Deltaproteobacteria bacterium]|nr:response regulator [Deltaproteobacteria bacterium]